MILMHGNTLVADIVIENNKPIAYNHIYDETKLPIGTFNTNKNLEKILLSRWHESRSIPDKRPNMFHLEQKLGIKLSEAFFKSAGISITDRYWIKNNCDITILWEDINYHDNGFDPIFAKYYETGNITFAKTPDFTTDGIMEKFWLPIGNEPNLFKIDNKYDNVLCANEIVYHKIAEDLGIKTTPYFSSINDKHPYCFCPCFIKDSKSDFINAMQVKHTDFSKTGESLLRYFMKDLHFEKEIREMITLDCLLHNTNRHERNFGYIKSDIDENKFVPLFDNGFCLGVNRDCNHPITDADMKLLNDKRSVIIEKYGLSIPIDEKYMYSILENVYKEFNIPEERFLMAKEELKYGCQLIERQRNISIFVESTNIEEVER